MKTNRSPEAAWKSARCAVGVACAFTAATAIALQQKSWRGWDGELCWESLEGDLRLAITSSITGHVTIRVTLSNYGDDDWRLEAPIFAKAGQLESIARQVAAFFH